MKIHDVEQGSREWLNIRLGKLTASRAQAIITNGRGLDTLCFEAVTEILTGKPISTYTNEAMENGKNTEEEAGVVYSLNTGRDIERVGFVELNKRVGCSPDGFVADGLIEIKCPTPRVYTEYLYTRKVDPKYFAQIQMQMYVADKLWCDYVVFNPDFQEPMIIQRIERDKKTRDKLEIGLERGVNKIQEILEKLNG